MGAAGEESLRTTIGDPANAGGNARVGAPADASSHDNALFTKNFPHLFNGTNYDRERNNEESTQLASAARVATTSGAGQTNFNARGVMLFLNVTANPGAAETLTVSIEFEDPVSGAFQALTAFAATATANASYAYVLYPGAVETSLVAELEVQGLPLPRNWRVTVTHSAAGSWTYSVGVAYIL